MCRRDAGATLSCQRRRAGGVFLRATNKRLSQFGDPLANFTGRHLPPLAERISRVAVGTSQIARRETDKDARQPREGAFALNAQVDFVDNQGVVHDSDNLSDICEHNTTKFEACAGLGSAVRERLRFTR